eukprot:Nitzschia sp. Nitz4//scaffold1_size375055//101975//103701//NITZ4_000240-RA/size375055-augustus-gene-0.668-mRNA-1//1//CDS//3329540937//8104//frame0
MSKDYNSLLRTATLLCWLCHVSALVITEVSLVASSDECDGDWVELYNSDSTELALGGYVVGRSFREGSSLANDASIGALDYFVACLDFDVVVGSEISVYDSRGSAIDVAPVVGDGTDMPEDAESWALNGGDFAYSLESTPGTDNVFPFAPVDLGAWQSCGLQTEEHANLCGYELQSTYYGGDMNVEFSAGAFDGRTCTHYLVGDEGTVTEMSLSSGSYQEIRKISIVGGSSDVEGDCFYNDETNGVVKFVLLDERTRAVSICDLPSEDQDPVLYLDSMNCETLALPDDLFSDPDETSADANQGFEGVACDPANGKVYIAQEKRPMRIWQLDVATGEYSTLIDVENNSHWTDRITDIAGIDYDPMTELLYVLSQESKAVLTSTMSGDIVGLMLSVDMANQPEGIHFIPSTGELVISSEPNEVFRFVKRENTNYPSTCMDINGAVEFTPLTLPPAPAPTAPAPTVVPTTAPTPSPTTATPSANPTSVATHSPTALPTVEETIAPTPVPTTGEIAGGQTPAPTNTAPASGAFVQGLCLCIILAALVQALLLA